MTAVKQRSFPPIVRCSDASEITAIPISTVAPTALPSRISSLTSFTPALVSIDTFVFSGGTIPLSYIYLATHLTPLPHIAPSDPSRLNMCMKASALSDSSMSISPSLPIPYRLSESSMARLDGSCTLSSKQLTYI